MKILALADAASIHTHKWASYFASRGHELEIISFTPAKLDYAQVHHIHTGALRPEGGNWHYLLGLPEARRHIVRIAPDLLFCQYLTSYGLIGALLKPSIPLVIRLQGTDILATPSRSVLHRLTARYALNRSDLIIMAAPHMSDHVEELVGVGKRTIALPLGIDLQKFNQNGTSKRKEFSCISNRVLVRRCNVDLIIRAIAQVRQIQPAVHLTVVGSDYLKPDLEAIVHSLDLEPWVTFLGKVANEAMSGLLREHSYYLSAANFDGTSNSLLEAMACGTFPIVSDIRANDGWIRSGTNGFRVPLGRADLFASYILKAFESPKLLSSARKVNWQIIEEHGDFLVNMKKTEQAVEQLLDAKTLEVAS